ncbi:MAG: hypothetical protein HYW63_04385, partial [Candidatus Levybacteria bacterium]|nr:hypothetical protein [Candidatus Levybacteria bacterium]
MKKKFLLSLVSFIGIFLLFLFLPESSYALNIRGGFYSRDPVNVRHEVCFRVLGRYGTAREQTGPRWCTLVDDRECFGISGCNRFKYFEFQGVVNNFEPEYRLQWGTGCIDPAPRLTSGQNYEGVPFLIPRGNPIDVTAPDRHRDGIQYFSSQGGGIIRWGGWGNERNCPTRPCQPETCADRGYQCGSFTDGCGNVRNCGSCPGTQVCSSGRCEQNYGCTDNGACVEKQCQ